MPVGNVAGLSSGIDWNETITSMMEIERRPVDILEARREVFQTQLTNWSSIESKLTALKSIAGELDSRNEFLAKSATTEDSAILSVSANADATPGSHQVIINRLATNHIHAHRAGWVDLNTTAVNNSGSDQSFSYEYAGTAVTVTVPDGTTLQELADLINRDPDNAGVVATIIDDGSGADRYHLMLSGEDTGSGKTVQVIDTVDNPTDLYDGSLFDDANWNATQTAGNAEIRVDDFPDPGWGWPNPWIEAETNDVEDVIPGITLHLHDTSDGDSIQIGTSLDKATIKENVQALVSAYNEVFTAINEVTGYDAETETAGALFGDSLTRGIKNTLLRLIAQNIPGTDAGDKYRSLGQVGVNITAAGGLSVDESKLEEALDDDPLGVARLFVFDAESSSGLVSVTGHNENSVGGSYDFTLTYDADGKLVSGATNTLGGEDCTIHGDSLVSGKTGTPVEGLVMLLTNPGDGPNSLSGSIKVYTGFSILISNEILNMTDQYEGTIAGTRERINDSIELLDQRIESWETRLEAIEDNYRRQYTQMETIIGQLNAQSSYLSAL
jgi:flagellar hook-associated protein 2